MKDKMALKIIEAMETSFRSTLLAVQSQHNDQIMEQQRQIIALLSDPEKDSLANVLLSDAVRSQIEQNRQ